MNFFDEIEGFDEDLINQFPGQGTSSSSSSSSPPCYPGTGANGQPLPCSVCVNICDINDGRTWAYTNTLSVEATIASGSRCICVPDCYKPGEFFDNRLMAYYSDATIEFVNSPRVFSRGSIIGTGITLYSPNPCSDKQSYFDIAPIQGMLYGDHLRTYSGTLIQNNYYVGNNLSITITGSPTWSTNNTVTIPAKISLSNNIYPRYTYADPNYVHLDFWYQFNMHGGYAIGPNTMSIAVTGQLRDPNAPKLNQSIAFNNQTQNYLL